MLYDLSTKDLKTRGKVFSKVCIINQPFVLPNKGVHVRTDVFAKVIFQLSMRDPFFFASPPIRLIWSLLNEF